MNALLPVYSACLMLLAGAAAAPPVHGAPARPDAPRPASPAHPAPPAGSEKPAPELFLAIGQGDAAGVDALLAHGANPNARNTIGMSALMIAAGTGRAPIMRALKAAGAQVNVGSPYGNALSFAAAAGRPEAARLLLEWGTEINAARPDHLTTVMLAARAGDADLVRRLLARGAPVAAQDNHHATALTHAAAAGRTEAARVLLDAGAKADGADLDGWTPLMHAAANGHASMITLLLQHGASAGARDRKGRTALHLAAGFGDHPEAVAALCGAGASLDALDAAGHTARSLAETRGYTESGKLLRERGARAIPAAAMPLRTPREAAQAGLRQVQHAMEIFSQRTGCVSCHHEGLGRYATGFARSHGFAVDAALDRAGEKRVLASLEELRPFLRKALADPAELKNVPIMDLGDVAPTYGTLFLGIAERRAPASGTLADTAMVLARTQSPDGAWRFGMVRAPIQSSFFSTTAMAVRALRAYAPQQSAPEVEERIARAKRWLLQAPAAETEDRVFRLLGLSWAGAPAGERRQALDELRKTQRPDGGWAQLPGIQSDAYATGTALFALSQGGGLAVSDPVYQRGVRFLLRTQEADGTWYVSKRAIPGNNYFDAEFPYGESQYVSHAAACWATMALVLAAEAPGPSTAAR